MNKNSHHPLSNRRGSGYALLTVLVFTAASALVLAATMRRTYSSANLNERNNQMVANLNAAEAAAEKVYARMAYDFASYGIGQVTSNLTAYRSGIPSATENAYWGNFDFSDGNGNGSKTYVNWISNYSGSLPSQYPGLFTIPSPVYRIVSNARTKNSRFAMTNAVQVDVLLAMVPITTYAIFYNGVLEFSDCATMTVRGRVHANDAINVGAGGSSTLTFNGTVTTTSTLSAPDRNGNTWGTAPSGWRTTFNGAPNYSTNVPRVSISMNMTNTHELINIPATNDAATITGQQRLYNQAQVILLVSNNWVNVKIQAPISGNVPGMDPSPTILSYTNTPNSIRTNLYFLNLTNTFTDQREGKKILATQIDVGKYATWVQTNSQVQGKLPTASSLYPTILFVADNRSNTSTNLSAIRLTNGVAPPVNGGHGFTVATPNPLYVWGHYNATNNLGSTNTSTTVPCALMSDALTLLSPNWQDSQSAVTYVQGSTRNATDMTVNAAILTGAIPSTGSSKTTFSGGVHNLTRMLEDWTGDTLTLNTSIVNLYNSEKATHQWMYQGTYYNPPTRNWSFDNNFLNPAKQPPGIPTVLVPIRYGWTQPPPNVVSYNVTP